MRRLLTFLASAVLLLSVPACDTFVEDVDDPIDTIGDEQLNDVSQVPFVITGVEARFSTTYGFLTVFAGGLSDELIFDQRVPNATFPTFAEFDSGDIQFANNSNDGLYNDVGELRFFADNLLERIATLEFVGEEEQAIQREAQFVGNFYGGIARYILATYYALTPDQPGGVITTDPDNPGPFLPAADLYSQALEKLEAAKAFASDYQTRVINTLIARIHLFQGNYGAAQTAAAAGLQEGDDPFGSLHSVDNSNYWYVQAGRGRSQFVADFVYKDYVDADPNEAARIPLDPIEGNDGTTFYRQGKYLERTDPIPLVTWQENALILAEIDVRNGSTAPALQRVNEVRASHGIDPLDSVDLDTIALERRKELFTMGLRLVDQRRFDQWHLPAGTWQYLPLTQSERNGNPNLGS
ncbi:hypothetical protein AWN76_011400 [Rhodothermaceae bacterium RA]|nr:hypothetical protein AWN76_011400 [Rhodothermaceae bacterium RA]